MFDAMAIHELHELERLHEFFIDIRENSINDPPRLSRTCAGSTPLPASLQGGAGRGSAPLREILKNIYG